MYDEEDEDDIFPEIDLTELQEIDEQEDELAHIGTKRHSGRYKWGSGENPNQRNRDFLATVDHLKRSGLTDKQIADGMEISTTAFRARKTIAKNQQKQEAISQAQRLRAAGNSNIAIGREMGLNESSVRALLAPEAAFKADRLITLSNMLKDSVDEKTSVQIGAGVELALGVSDVNLRTAVTILEEQGYRVDTVKVPQLGTGKLTTVKVLSKPDVEYRDLYHNPEKIQLIGAYSTDNGSSFDKVGPPKSISSSRVGVRYAEEGGTDRDGVIQVRRGVDDISLGNSKYAQVRIAVDDSHYLKGMAVYADDLPKGVDLMFNTNKSNTGNKLDAMKKLKDDEDLPFGAIVRQRKYIDADGKEQQSTLNIVNEEGDWGKWSRNLSSQALSKQTPALAKEQLAIKMKQKEAEFEEIMALTNPAVKRKLLESFSDDMDSSATHLKAAALPRQSTQVILPINSLKDNEIFAPNYKDGETVVLVRYPHGGIFEVPELKVNNKNKEARSIMSQARDAVGINSKVAEQLSGADFDGDTVLVIPNNNQRFKSDAPLKQLKNFNPQKDYPAYEGMPRMDARMKQIKMGDVSNLITDMTIRKASHDEIARAVKHSMVVIDAEKHNLNWKQSAKDNNIAELKKKYQGSARSGATTLISQASSPTKINARIPRRAANGGPIDPATGKKMYEDTGESYIDKNGKTVVKKMSISRMASVDDAYLLSSGTPMEKVYADHANKLKALANTARKNRAATMPLAYSPSAKRAYLPQVNMLRAKLNEAKKNAPLEKQAQLLGNAMVKAKRDANPDMEDAEYKKLKSVALATARARVNAKKKPVVVTPLEWEAIQAGAISNNFLEEILSNMKADQIKELATPRERTVVSPSNLSRAKAMLKSGYQQAEIAEVLGIAPSTLNDALGKE